MLEIDEGAVGPQALAELVSSDYVAGALEHHAENLERLLLSRMQLPSLRSSRERTSSSNDPEAQSLFRCRVHGAYQLGQKVKSQKSKGKGQRAKVKGNSQRSRLKGSKWPL